MIKRTMTISDWFDHEPDPLAVIYGVKPMDPDIEIVPNPEPPSATKR